MEALHLTLSWLPCIIYHYTLTFTLLAGKRLDEKVSVKATETAESTILFYNRSHYLELLLFINLPFES